MRTYTVHQKPFWESREGADDTDGIVVLKDGFNWFAFVLAPVWALWHRLWWVALALAGLAVALQGGALALDLDARAADALGLALAFWIGCEANDLRRWTMRRRGWQDLGLVVARTQDEAERRFFGPRAPGAAAAAS
jgi:hypothetical protein